MSDAEDDYTWRKIDYRIQPALESADPSGVAVRIVAFPGRPGCLQVAYAREGAAFDDQPSHELTALESGAVLGAFAAATVAALPPPFSGIHCTSYRLTFQQGDNLVEYRWNHELPAAWSGLAEGLRRLEALAASRLPTHDSGHLVRTWRRLVERLAT